MRLGSCSSSPTAPGTVTARPPRGPSKGAWFLIYWGQVSADSDGPVECCKPVPADQAEAFAAQIPALTLRVEPAHREAYVNLGPTGKTGISPANFQLAEEALRNYAAAQGIDDSKLALTPADLGVRITYLYTLPITDKTVPRLRLRGPVRLGRAARPPRPPRHVPHRPWG